MLNPTDEIKSKLDIVEVIREYIQLKAAGINFRALCPFHHEKTPSFLVSPEKQIWHCFGCGKGGDIFSFIMEIEGIGFAEALRLLAQKAGVILKRTDPQLVSQRNRLLDMTELAAKFYHQVLSDHPEAVAIRSYLIKRGLDEETINTWQIGYSLPQWDSLVKLLTSKGYSGNEIFLAGLSVKRGFERGTTNAAHANENRNGFYDRFRGRIMFPINDVNGSVVGFSARVSPEDEAKEKLGKYINSPQTMIYDKSRILFGLDKAKLNIKKQDAGILVEGQMDAITAHQYGFTNVVASSGTALTANQIALLKRYSENLILAFDRDRAGDLAAERGITQAMQAEMNINVIELTGGKDPDECIRQNPESWRQAVAQAKPMMQYFFDKTLAEYDPSQLDQRRQAVKILLSQLVKLANKIEQDYWLKKLSQLTDVAENFLREEIIKLGKRNKQVKTDNEDLLTKDQPVSVKQTREEMLSELILAMMLKFPAHFEYVINHIGPDHLVGEVNQLIYKNLIIYYNKIIEFQSKQINQATAESDSGQTGETFNTFNRTEQLGEGKPMEIDCNEFKNWLRQNELNLIRANQDENNQLTVSVCVSRLDKLVLLADKDFYDLSQELAKRELINIVTILKKNYLIIRLKQITKLISQIEKDHSTGQEDNKIKLNTLLEEFKTLTEELGEMED